MPQFNPPIATADARRYLKLAESCPYRTKEPGCCTGYLSACHKSIGGKVTHFECIECQRILVGPARSS